MSSDGATYKPTENDGLKQDGTPDKRVGTGGMYSYLNIVQMVANLQQSSLKDRSTHMRLVSKEDNPPEEAVTLATLLVEVETVVSHMLSFHQEIHR